MLSKKLSIFIANVLWVLGASCWHRMCGKRYRKPNFAGKKIKLFVFDFDQTVSSVHCFKQLAGWEVPSAQLKEFSSHFWRFEPILSENLLNNFIKLLLFPKLQFIGRSNVTLLRRVTVIFPNSKFRNYYCTTKFKISPKNQICNKKILFITNFVGSRFVKPPFEISERGQVHLVSRLNGAGKYTFAPGGGQRRPFVVSLAGKQPDSGASWSCASLGGQARVDAMKRFFRDLHEMDAILVVCTKGYVDTVRKILADVDMEKYFSRFYGRSDIEYQRGGARSSGQPDDDKSAPTGSPRGRSSRSSSTSTAWPRRRRCSSTTTYGSCTPRSSSPRLYW